MCANWENLLNECGPCDWYGKGRNSRRWREGGIREGNGDIQHSSTQKIKSEIAKTAAPASAAHHPLRLL